MLSLIFLKFTMHPIEQKLQTVSMFSFGRVPSSLNGSFSLIAPVGHIFFYISEVICNADMIFIAVFSELAVVIFRASAFKASDCFFKCLIFRHTSFNFLEVMYPV